ncbi:UbiH/UbiF/VisC/COQ6 family ubiquinone biosynthesis hydroxylase [Jannaschia sp. W003]|nr:UbiH/UbiF/VisC/COQ6 family ubiquinone biosynthesis hydroxylase [Jannaschia sp. W003]UWQ22964.1 UbiH/UbiF/VisC/COQ6 family ubiquinone biosynthesis hydroxylase [Jannaschia sp. W003]
MDTDALIVGGGLNGPLAALALARAGMRCTLLDAGARPERGAFDGRAYALALSSVRMLRALGVWERLEDPEPIRAIRASDGRAGEGASPLHLRFDAEAIGEPSMGHMAEDRHLRHALLAACDAEGGVTMRFGARVVAQAPEPAGIAVTLEGGESLRASLLVGCDGRASGVALRAGLRRTRKDYRQTALTCAVAHERPHGGVAHQLFLPAGPLAILPLAGDRSSLVWTETREEAERIHALGDDAYLEELRPRFGSFLGNIRIVGRRGTYPLARDYAADLVAERVALAGDAAHGIHPIAGQGLNLGFKDVAALGDVVAAARRRGEDIGSAPVLRRYARWRRFDAAQMGVATDAVNALFSNDDPVLRGLRRLGLGAVDAAAPLKRHFIREAAGLAGDLPALMRE